MNDKRISRRLFLTTTSMAAATAAIAKGSGSIIQQGGVMMQPGMPADLKPWYERTMRWVQIVFTEGDTDKYDPQWWLDLFKRAHVDGLCLVAGGVAAFYPTKIPFHPKAVYMKEGQDMFGDIVRPAQKMGITIVARTDAQACLNEAAALHPEWLNIDDKGKPRKHKSFLDTRTVTCGYGDYNFKYMTSIHKEIMENYMVDGLFCNRWQGWARGMCYCKTCQKLFAEFSGGMALPRKHSQKDVIKKYYEWETERLTELWHLWDGEIRKINPNARYYTNVGIDIDRATELAPIYICEAQGRGNNEPWHFGESGKRMRTIFGPNKKIIALGGMTYGSRHSVAPEAEVRMWLLSAITSGLSPWIIKSSATNWDNRWIPALEKVYKWHYENEDYMKNKENFANVAILFRKDGPRNPLLGTGATTAVGGDVDIDPEGRLKYPDIPVNDGAEITGFYNALVEARIPFEMAYNQKLESSDIDKFKVLILANASHLTESECEKIRQYVKRGGSIVATFETSLYDETGKRRPDFGLADLFGVKNTADSGSNGSNAYIRLEHDTKHPILSGLEEAQQIVSTGRSTKVQSTASFSYPAMTKIPTYPTDPMEHIYPRIPKTDIPEVYTREINDRSRVVYLPGDIGGTFSRGMAPDFVTVIKNAVEWAMNGPKPVTVSGPGMLEVSCWGQEKSMTVHMLNCTNPFMLRSAYREDIPIGAQHVTVHIPSGKTARDIKLLVAGTRPRVERLGNTLSFIIPSIVDHEVVGIDFA